jgi:hypothetical protein
MTQKEQQRLTIGDTVWCVHPPFTYLLETRVTEMRVFNVNQDEPEKVIEPAIEYTLVGHGFDLPFSEGGKWFVYDNDMTTEFHGEQECYYTTKDNAMLGLIRTLRTLAEAYLVQLENKYL